MRKSRIVTLVACSIAALILTAALVIGIQTDGFGLVHMWARAENSSSRLSETYEYSWEAAGTEGLDISWVSGRVTLKPATGDQIKITERAGRPLKEDERLRLTSEGDIVKIDWKKEGISWDFLFSFFSSIEKELIVEIPAEVLSRFQVIDCGTVSGDIYAQELFAQEIMFSTTSGTICPKSINGEKMKMSTSSGDINGERIITKGLELSTMSGGVKFQNTQAEKVKISTVSGGIWVSGSVQECDLSSVSGSMESELSACPKQAEMASVSGGITLCIPENPGFEVDFDTVSGRLESDFLVTGNTGNSGRMRYGNGDARFKFSTTSGITHIQKKK